MRLSLRFIVPLFLALAASAYAAVLLVDKLRSVCPVAGIKRLEPGPPPETPRHRRPPRSGGALVRGSRACLGGRKS